MPLKGFKWPALCIASTLFAAALFGCGEKKTAPSDTGIPQDAVSSKNAGTVKDAAEPPATEPSPEVLAKLADFDAFDGARDQVVSNCANCALAMKGQSGHQLKVGDYTLYFCSEGCAKSFGKDTYNRILALKLPEK